MRDKNKFRMTHQRMVILEEVKKDHSHPTADDIFAGVYKKMPRISLATVYRNLEMLEDFVIDSADQALAGLQHSLKNVNESGIISHRLEFVGLCKKCRATKPSEEKDENGSQI